MTDVRSCRSPTYLGPPGRDTVLPTGMVCSGASFEKHCDLARQVVGLQHLHFHDLRHVANALAAASGATTKELMYRMGHASPAAALRHQHVTRDRDAVIAAALGEVMTGQPAPVTPLRVPGATASRRQVR
jgi:integrase